MSRINDLTGQRFGRLVVKGYSHSNKHGRAVWNCVCDCGNISAVVGGALLRGTTKSCGCHRNDAVAKLKLKHGKCGTRLYGIWMAMQSRCNNINFIEYDRYGGRGIAVCEEWQSFEPFYEWAIANGYRDNLTIERKNNDGNYCPENCRWATYKEQANNTSRNHFLTLNGETHTMVEWSEITGISYHNIRNRVNNLKWSVEKALTTPTKGS